MSHPRAITRTTVDIAGAAQWNSSPIRIEPVVNTVSKSGSWVKRTSRSVDTVRTEHVRIGHDHDVIPCKGRHAHDAYVIDDCSTGTRKKLRPGHYKDRGRRNHRHKHRVVQIACGLAFHKNSVGSQLVKAHTQDRSLGSRT